MGRIAMKFDVGDAMLQRGDALVAFRDGGGLLLGVLARRVALRARLLQLLLQPGLLALRAHQRFLQIEDLHRHVLAARHGQFGLLLGVAQLAHEIHLVRAALVGNAVQVMSQIDRAETGRRGRARYEDPIGNLPGAI